MLFTLGDVSPCGTSGTWYRSFLNLNFGKKKSSNDRNLSKLIAGKTLFSPPRARGARGPPGLSVSVACPHVVKRADYSSRAGAARRGAADEANSEYFVAKFSTEMDPLYGVTDGARASAAWQSTKFSSREIHTSNFYHL